MKKDITDYKIADKRVILRCDLNVPMENGVITDDTRIKASKETIEHLIYSGAKTIILSHLGRIKEEGDKLNNSLKPVAERLSELIGKEVKFIPYTRGKEVEEAVKNMKTGDVVMLENTRFEDVPGNKESSNDSNLAAYWASLGELFVNDAFGTIHRAHASNVGIAQHLPSAMGFLVKNEVEKISYALNNPERPLVVMLGGAKVSDKLGVIGNAVKIADYVLIGGGMHYTFYKALGYEIGNSICDDDSLDFCREIYEKYSYKIILPEDVVLASSMDENAAIRVGSFKDIGKNDIGVDLGVKTLARYKNILSKANTIIWNGPMGVFEINPFSKGTRKIVETLNGLKAFMVIGGGNSIAALNKCGFNNKNAFISTGGGASLEMLEGKELPGLKAISNK